MGLRGNLKSGRVLVDEMIGRRTKIREIYCEHIHCRCSTRYMHRFLEDYTHINKKCPGCGGHRGAVVQVWFKGKVLMDAIH